MFEYKSNKKFCSRKCKQKSKDIRLNRNAVKQQKKQRPYRFYVKSSCEFCGFIPVHICQLDVDHKDGNKSNNDISNLQTLCANCHMLKTYLNSDWEK